MESCVQRWRPRTNAFRDFPIHLSKQLRLPRTSDARSYEVLHLSRKIISADLKIWCSKMQPFSGHQRKMHLCRSSSIFWNATKPSRFAHFWQGPQSLAPATRKRIWTSKSGPCLAGVALRDIDRHFAWQAWHWWHCAGSGGALGSRLVPWAWPLFAWQAWNCWHWAGSGGALGSHLVPWARPLFAWQAWNCWHWAGSSVPIWCRGRGRCLRGRGGTWRHRPSLCVAGVALGDIDLHFAWPVWHLWHWTGSGATQNSSTQFCHRFISHTTLWHTTLSHTSLSHTSFYTQLCHIQLFHTQHFYIHKLAHTALSPNLSCTISFPSCLSHLIFTSAWWSLEEVDLWGYPVL